MKSVLNKMKGMTVNSEPCVYNIEKTHQHCVELDENSLDPKKAWKIRSQTQTQIAVKPCNPLKPIDPDKLRIVCISDTHDQLGKMMSRGMIPLGDILIHTGDITLDGEPESIIQFNRELGNLPHKVKLVIAGNHDYSLDRSIIDYYISNDTDSYIPTLGYSASDIEASVKLQTGMDVSAMDLKSVLTNCIYLEDSMVDVCGVKFYGTPWVERYTKCWAFSLSRGRQLFNKWKMIPDDVDILMTHTPPLGYCDVSHRGLHVGCVDLLNTIQQRVKPKYHVFGHIHEGYGMMSDGTTTYINCASCTKDYRPRQPPIVFDFPLPQNHSKNEGVTILKEIGPPSLYTFGEKKKGNFIFPLGN